MRILVGIHEPGIIDHVNALAIQMTDAGAEVTYVPAGDNLTPQQSDEISKVAPTRKTGESVYETDVPNRLSGFDAAFVQTPYDEQREPIWRELNQTDKLAYAGYGTALSNWTRGHFDLDFYSRCGYLLVSSERSVGEHTKRGVSPANVRHTGDALLFEVSRAVQGEASPPLSPNILWLPHWTLDWFGSPGYSTWSTTVHDVLSVAEVSEVAVTIRPHPLLRQTLEDAGHTPEGEALRRLMDLPNVHLSANSLVSDLLRATAVLTDGVSVISYSCASGLPVGVCRRPDSPPFGTAGTDIVNRCDVLAGSDDRMKWLLRHSNSTLSRNPRSPAAQCVYEWFPLRADTPGKVFLDWLDE